jgi:hypothetical protein
MSDHAECPLCGYMYQDMVMRGDPRWGHALSHDPSKMAKRIFWCPCGRMVWMEGQGWMVHVDFVARLATAIRESLPDDYLRMMAVLAVAMPEEIQRVRTLLGLGTL